MNRYRPRNRRLKEEEKGVEERENEREHKRERVKKRMRGRKKGMSGYKMRKMNKENR